jgi:site-specific DNA recombinase
MAEGMKGTRGAAIYARYSSDLQDANSIDDQVARLKQRIARDGGALDQALVFSDSAESGSLWERPGLQALLRAVAESRVTAL